jgi:hypothetical protein
MVGDADEPARHEVEEGQGHRPITPAWSLPLSAPGRVSEPYGVFLPFEEDGGLLSVIISKAFLLADDASITDPTITRQIRG